MKAFIATLLLACALPAIAADLPSDCQTTGINAPIVTVNADGSTSSVQPNTVHWCSTQALAPQDDPTFSGSGGSDSK